MRQFFLWALLCIPLCLWGFFQHFYPRLHAYALKKATATVQEHLAPTDKVSFERISLAWPWPSVCVHGIRAQTTQQNHTLRAHVQKLCVRVPVDFLLHPGQDLRTLDIPWASFTGALVELPNPPYVFFSQGRITHMGFSNTWEMEGLTQQGALLRASLEHTPQSTPTWHAQFEAENIPLHQLPKLQKHVSGWADISAQTTGSSLHTPEECFFNIDFSPTYIQHPSLGQEPLQMQSFSAQGRFEQHNTLSTLEGHVGFAHPSSWEVPFAFSWRNTPSKPFTASFTYHEDARLLQHFIQSNLHAPEGLPRIWGPLHIHLHLAGRFTQPTSWKLEGLLNTSLLEVSFHPNKNLRSHFMHTPSIGNTSGKSLDVSAQNTHFTPLSQLPSYLTRAILLSEDAGFYGHQGFDFEGLQNGLIVSFLHKKWVRGGSTITQQLAKNLFFSKEKSLSRKIQESLTTLALETGLSKSRILEIYMNIIEWGPNTFGITDASYLYFGKHPSSLQVKEAAFLASIIPNPRRFFMYYQRGALTPAWEERLAVVLTKLHAVGEIDEATYDEALHTPLYFNKH
jgi:hypothetical protein